MKFPMKWHRECWENSSKNLIERRANVARQVAGLEKYEQELAFYAEQIAAAEARKLGAFDRDRLLVKRKRKG